MEVPRRSRKKQRKEVDRSFELLDDDEFMSVETIDLTTPKKRTLVENHFSSLNGNLSPQEKKFKHELLPDSSRRSQPHRAARFTDSYSVPVETAVPSDEEKQKNGECSSSGSSSEDSSDCEIIPQSPKEPLTDEQQLEWEKKVEELQKALCSEEVKLALLRKLKHSQEKKEEKKETPCNPMPLPPHINSLNKARALKEITITATTSVSQSPTKKLMMNSNKRSPKPLPQELKKENHPTSRNDGPVNLVMKNEKPIITIQPIKVDIKAPQANSTTVILPTVKTPDNAKTPSSNVTSNHQAKVNQEKINKEMTIQRQAAAKLALRKQLEKTLLQIPRPKPPAPELHFLPNANTPQFIYYLGLDIIVDFLTKTKRPSSHIVEPFICSECKTDFTATWRTIKKSKSSQERNVICDTCFSVTAKRSLKTEHTSRLKGAFVKALQQEKEIERLSSSNFSYPSSSTTSTTHTIAFDTILPSSSSSSTNNKVASSQTSSSRQSSLPNSPDFFLPNSHLLNLSAFSKLTQHQLQAFIQAQAQSLMAANLPLPAHMVPLSPFIPPYPYHLANKSSSAQNELQRQYLLDMIPPRRQT